MNKKEEKTNLTKGLASLPTNRKELFFDIIKQRWRTLFLIGIIFFFCFIPFLIFLFLRRINFNYLIKQNADAYQLIINNVLYFSFAVISLIIPTIFLGGILKNLKNLSFNEPIFFKEDFFSGIKENFFSIFFSSLLFCFFLLGTLFIISIDSVDVVIKGLAVGILIFIFFPLLCLTFHQTILYNNKFKDYLFNSVLLYIKNFLYLIFFSLINFLPLLFCFVSNPLVFITCLVFYFLFVEPFVLLFDILFLNYLFDKSLNKDYYPKIYQKGLYLVSKNIGEKIDMFTLDSTYNDIFNNKTIGKYSSFLLAYHLNKDLYDTPILSDLNVKARQNRIDSLNDLVAYEKEGILSYKVLSETCSYLMFKQNNKDAKVAIVGAGGGYYDVCTLPESLPVSVALYKKGFTVITFNYGVMDNAFHNKAYKDLCLLLDYLNKNQKQLEINLKDYLIIGFSASGHLVATLGTDNFGFRVTHLPKPKLMVLCYPVISMHKEYAEKGSRWNLLGENPTLEEEKEYSIEDHVGDDYPSVFMYHAEKDPCVDVINAKMMDMVLTKHKIPHMFYTIDDAYHGYSLGIGSKAEGWFEKMLDYYNKI